MCPLGLPEDYSTALTEKPDRQEKKGENRSVEERLQTIEALCRILLTEYKDDVDCQKELLAIKNERETFTKDTVPSIRQYLLNHRVAEKIVNEWLAQISEVMDKSLDISENLITTYLDRKAEYLDKVSQFLMNSTVMDPPQNNSYEIKEAVSVLKKWRDSICRDSLECFDKGGDLAPALVERDPEVRDIRFFKVRLQWLASHWETLETDLKKDESIASETRSAIVKAFADHMQKLTPDCLNYSKSNIVLKDILPEFMETQLSKMQSIFQQMIDNQEECEKKWQLVDAIRKQMNQTLDEKRDQLIEQKKNEKKAKSRRKKIEKDECPEPQPVQP